MKHFCFRNGFKNKGNNRFNILCSRRRCQCCVQGTHWQRCENILGMIVNYVLCNNMFRHFRHFVSRVVNIKIIIGSYWISSKQIQVNAHLGPHRLDRHKCILCALNRYGRLTFFTFWSLVLLIRQYSFVVGAASFFFYNALGTITRKIVFLSLVEEMIVILVCLEGYKSRDPHTCI
jgi:hypothetical protein